MKSIFFLLVWSVCGLFVSCSNGGKPNMFPDLSKADSASILYYHTPDSPRFFTFVKKHNVSELEHVTEDAKGRFLEESPACPTLGKIYFYGEKGAIDIVYFNYNDQCRTISFIITGEMYFVRMSKESATLLHNLKSLAKEPVSIN